MNRSLIIAVAGVILIGILGYLILSDRLSEVEAVNENVSAETQAASTDSLTADQIATLSSLKRIDDHPFYTMCFVGPYRSVAAANTDPAVSGGVPVRIDRTADAAYACSLFVTFEDGADPVFGRSFDWSYDPILLLFTDPPDGNAGVSLVDLSYFVSEDLVTVLDEMPIESLRGLLETPWVPFDGMNEHGLVVGMAAIPPAEMPIDPRKETRGSIDVIRDVLDYTSTVDEALDMLASVNIDMTGGPHIHYLIADADGHSAIVEFAGGDAHVFRPAAAWQQMTNFRLSDVPETDRAETCWRYATIAEELAAAEGRITIEDAMDLLERVHQASETKPAGTLWSAVYEMQQKRVHVAIKQRFDQIHTFELP